MPNLLFVCSKNQWRSPTAELLFKNHPLHMARSAGTGAKARNKINAKLIDWADAVFVMERKHKEILVQRFRAQLSVKQITVLNIPDKYQFNSPELVALLQQPWPNIWPDCFEPLSPVGLSSTKQAVTSTTQTASSTFGKPLFLL